MPDVPFNPRELPTPDVMLQRLINATARFRDDEEPTNEQGYYRVTLTERAWGKLLDDPRIAENLLPGPDAESLGAFIGLDFRLDGTEPLRVPGAFDRICWLAGGMRHQAVWLTEDPPEPVRPSAARDAADRLHPLLRELLSTVVEWMNDSNPGAPEIIEKAGNWIEDGMPVFDGAEFPWHPGEGDTSAYEDMTQADLVELLHRRDRILGVATRDRQSIQVWAETLAKQIAGDEIEDQIRLIRAAAINLLASR